MKRVIVCDSGLGGLNIASRFFSEKSPNGEKCELIYFNAYPSAACGFNKLPTLRDQEEVFKDVLESMKKFSPDLCLVACNTLSIVYDRLSGWYTPAFPVEGIVEAASCGMFQALNENPRSSLLILGTKTTVESGVYADKLIAQGIAPERIKALACPGLATLIESDPADPEVVGYITGTAQKAAGLFEKKPEKLFLGLCCTHFGFASGCWLKQFAPLAEQETVLVDPNELLGAEWAAENIRYFSKIGFFPGACESMCAYFEKTSPQIAGALKSACIDETLFNFEEGKYLK